jgi:hypothetical protein
MGHFWSLSDRPFEPLKANVARTFGRIFVTHLLLEDLFDYMVRLTEVLRSNSCSCEKKLLKEIEEGLPQNVRRMTRLGLILA